MKGNRTHQPLAPVNPGKENSTFLFRFFPNSAADYFYVLPAGFAGKHAILRHFHGTKQSGNQFKH